MPVNISIAVVQLTGLPTFRLDVKDPFSQLPIPFPGEGAGLIFPLRDPAKIDVEYIEYDKLLTTLPQNDRRSLTTSYSDFLSKYAIVLEEYVEHILHGCRQRNVSLVVFPEYTLPAFIWSRNADGGRIVVDFIGKFHALAKKYQVNLVAGTHAIGYDELKHHSLAETIAQRLGETPWERVAICPILPADDRSPELIFKQARSKYEGPELDEVNDPDRLAVVLPIPQWALDPQDPQTETFRLGVAICSEFVREAEVVSITRQVQGALANCEVIAIPAWSPPEAFAQEVGNALCRLQHANRVTYAFVNSSLAGGSFIATQGDDFAKLVRLGPEQDGLLIRRIQVGVGGGAPYPFISRASPVFFIETCDLQQSYQNCVDALLCGEGLGQARERTQQIIGLPVSQTNLKTFKLVLERAVEQDDPSSYINRSAQQFFTIPTKASVIRCLYGQLLDSHDYLEKITKQFSLWHITKGFQAILGSKLADTLRLWLRDFNPDERDRFFGRDQGDGRGDLQSVPLEEEPPSSMAKRIDWTKYVTTGDVTEKTGFNFALQVTTLPDPDYGIAYQPRIPQQVMELLNRKPGVETIQLRFVTHGGKLSIFFLFRFESSPESRRSYHLAQEIYAIFEDRILFWSLELVKVDSSYFREYGGNTLFYPGHATRYFLKRVGGADDTGFYPFVGRGEANSVLNLLTPMSGANRLTITLHRRRENETPKHPSLNWDDIFDFQKNIGKVGSSVQTTIRDLQDIQDATDALSFTPAMFCPGYGDGRVPLFPAAIVLESSVPNLELIPETIGMELAGPGRYFIEKVPVSVEGESPALWDGGKTELFLAEREVHHLFRLPFGEQVMGFPRQATPHALLPSDLPPEEGVLIGKVAVKPSKTEPFYWNDASRERHMYLLGKTGSGKSYLIASMISRDIRAGRGVMLIDPHGDLVETVLKRMPTERLQDLILFDPGDTRFPPGLNLLDFDLSDPYQRSMVLEEAVSIFLSLYGPEIFGPRIQQYFRGAVLSLIDYGDVTGHQPTLLDVARIFVDFGFQRQVIARVRDPVARLFWIEYENSNPKEKKEMIPYFQAKFGPLLSNRVIRNVIGQGRSLIHFPSAIRRNAVILVNLSRGRIGDINADLLGMILVAKFNWAILARAHMPWEQRPPFSLYVDEFQNVASRTFSGMLSEARKYGLSLVLANQYLGQLKLFEDYTKIDPDNLLHAVFGNVETIVSFQTGREDAEYLARQMNLSGPMKSLDPTPLQQLPRFRAMMSTARDGRKLPPCYLESLYWEEGENSEIGQKMAEFAKLSTCPPEGEISDMIDKMISPAPVQEMMNSSSLFHVGSEIQ